MGIPSSDRAMKVKSSTTWDDLSGRICENVSVAQKLAEEAKDTLNRFKHDDRDPEEENDNDKMGMARDDFQGTINFNLCQLEAALVDIGLSLRQLNE